jgi:hypothetical protein
MPTPPVSGSHLRIARPTDNISALRPFYIDGLGFEVLYEFKDHAGFDGLMLGHTGAQYHLEFTQKHGHTVGKAPTEDNLLVFYLPDHAVWREVRSHGYKSSLEPCQSMFWQTAP